MVAFTALAAADAATSSGTATANSNSTGNSFLINLSFELFERSRLRTGPTQSTNGSEGLSPRTRKARVKSRQGERDPASAAVVDRELVARPVQVTRAGLRIGQVDAVCPVPAKVRGP